MHVFPTTSTICNRTLVQGLWWNISSSSQISLIYKVINLWFVLFLNYHPTSNLIIWIFSFYYLISTQNSRRIEAFMMRGVCISNQLVFDLSSTELGGFLQKWRKFSLSLALSGNDERNTNGQASSSTMLASFHWLVSTDYSWRVFHCRCCCPPSYHFPAFFPPRSFFLVHISIIYHLISYMSWWLY